MASSRSLTMPTSSSVIFLALLVLLSSDGVLVPRASAQQPYGSAISDCNNQHNDTGLLGYFCSTGSASSCATFLTFTIRPPHGDVASVAALLGVDAGGLAAANSVGETARLAEGTKVLVPTTCACTATPDGRFYQRNATYVVRATDILLSIANDRFQGLSTCQALQAQGFGRAAATSLQAGRTLPVPLRCACPSAAQTAAGARFLVSYLVGEADDVSSVAARFGVVQETVVAANELKSPFTIFPGTTLLIPVATQPNISQIQSSPAPPPPPPPVAPAPPAQKRSNRAGVYIGVAVAVAAVAAIAAAVAFLALKMKRRRRRGAVLATSAPASKKEGKGNERSSSSAFSGGETSASFSDAFSSISVSDIKSSLKVYTYAELRTATDDFSPEGRVGGSVYRAAFNGDTAAVEVVDRNVSAEVEIMRKINHLNLIRLIGLCHHHGRWYLVTEYAEHGALRDRLVLAEAAAKAAPLSWAQRVQVALDVAEGLRYLHEYADPPYVHMDVSSDSILLAGAGPRAKLRGFAAARAIRGHGGELMFTMTSRIAGTRGYMAPEYLEHGVVSPKADVYSLGVVLLELVTGKDVEELVGDGVGDPFAELRVLAAEQDDDAVLRRLEELVDPAMPAGSCPQDAVLMMVRLIERCVRRDAAGRPSMGEVAQRLLKLSGVSVVTWQGSRDPESPRSPGR